MVTKDDPDLTSFHRYTESTVTNTIISSGGEEPKSNSASLTHKANEKKKPTLKWESEAETKISPKTLHMKQ